MYVTTLNVPKQLSPNINKVVQTTSYNTEDERTIVTQTLHIP